MKQTKRQEIYQNCYEWSQVVYQLQIMTGRSSIKIIQLFKYPQRTTRYEQRSYVDALVDITECNSQYRKRIVNHTIPPQDVIFFCGHVNLQRYRSKPGKVFNYLICKTSLGIIGEVGDYGNDSIRIETENQEPFHFNFMVKSENQYDVRYQISFIVEDEIGYNNKEMICSICEVNLAEIYCRNQKMYFCETCSNNHHIQHTPRPIKPQKIQPPPPPPPHSLQRLNRINTLPLCQNHNIKNEYFCMKCEKYVCNICIQKASHNQNPEHIIKPIQFLYEQKAQSNCILPIIPLQKLDRLIESINEVSKQITNNYLIVKKQLTSEFQRAMDKLQKLYNEKIINIRSDQIELQMIYQKIQWSKELVKYQEKYLQPIHYFKLQSRYEAQMKDLSIRGYQNTFTIKGDLDYCGNLVVGTRQKVEAYKSTNEPKNINSKHVNLSGHQISILKFDPKNQPPKRGQLSLLLENSNLHFFKISPSNV